METKSYTDRAEYESARAVYEVLTEGYFAAIYEWERRLEAATKQSYELYGGWTLIAVIALASLVSEVRLPYAWDLYIAAGIGLRWFDKSVLENRRVEAFTRAHPRPTLSAVKPVWAGPKADDAGEQKKRDGRKQERTQDFTPGNQAASVAKCARVLRLNGKLTKRDIKKHYRELLMKYHPDMVATMGPEIREIAERKTKELNEAYEILERHYGL